MSDFISSGWSTYVAAVTVVSLLACLALLAVAARRKVMATDDTHGETTGHVWDEDLRELNNPLPRWWMGLFVLTVLFAGGYLALYPGLGSFGGSLGWSSAGQHQAEVAKAQAAAAPLYAQFAKLPAEELARNPQAMAMGERLFANNCATCHGADARGSKGFPNLTDGDWLGGDGSPNYIETTITKGRTGMMPPLAAAVGSPQDVANLAQYVLSLSGSPHDAIAAAQGKAKFTVCAACHGADGKGMAATGAPNLTDKVWLHGWGADAIVAMVTNGKTNVMPAHESRFTPEQIHLLGSYVWGLSKGAQPR